MGLERYRAKRDFRRTPEPRGGRGLAMRNGRSFVVQKHAARSLHYDFRLEHDGVLWSWAIPKGPSLDPADKRLAIHVEDHPIEYGGFEGTIPEGEYGGGAVIVWDRGTWSPEGDPAEGYARGRLAFTLDGEKLKGGFALVRTRSGGGAPAKEAWLLVKARDAFARRGDGALVEDAPDSVLSGRSIDEIASARSRGRRGSRSAKATADAGSRAPQAQPKSRATRAVPPEAKSAPGAGRARPKRRAEPGAGAPAAIALSNPDKPYFPEAGITKRDLADYYVAVAERLVPHIAGRPLSLVRCPDGWSRQCFYQKHAQRSVHAGVQRVEVPERTGTATYLAADSPAALVALVQWGVIELHPWGARRPRLGRPDLLVFDFDPGEGVTWRDLVAAVTLLRTLLVEIGLTGFLKTTGGKGLHVVLPIRATLDWDDAKAFTRTVAEFLARKFPDRFTTALAKAARTRRIFIDYLRNAQGATAIAPYAVRARAHAPVATPIAWNELDGEDVRFAHFNLRNVRRRLARPDPWADFAATRQSITAAMRRRFA